MTAPHRARRLTAAALAIALAATVAPVLSAQQSRSPELQKAYELDHEMKTAEAQKIYQSILDTISDAGRKAQIHRAMAMSYGFAGDCANTMKYEQMVIDYWKTQESMDPQNAFYQEGEMANEGARVCIDSGDLDAAEHWYTEGSRLGNMEPEPRTHPKSLWDFRLAHALARIASQRGDAAEAHRQVAAARAALDSDPEMAQQQERFFPYLKGYVDLYLGNLEAAETAFTGMLEMRGNQNDPFMNTLLAMTWEKMGKHDQAMEQYRKAYDMVRAHNPPAAYVRRVVGEKLGMGM